MKFKTIWPLCALMLFLAFTPKEVDNRYYASRNFSVERDLLLVHYDCKTDVDDLHSVAAFYTLINHSAYSSIRYHAVAGAYGEQKGLYVPPNKLFQKAFGKNWSDAHKDRAMAVKSVKLKAKVILENQGDVWIAEAGQSDFSADLVQALQKDLPDTNLAQRIHVVQHSDWNEEVATDEKLTFVKNNTDYQKINDGNFLNNGTPGFNSASFTGWENRISNPEVKKVWELAVKLSDRYNGKDGRYLNDSIAAGGLDFSDTSEVCWILDIEDIKDIDDFFNRFGGQ